MIGFLKNYLSKIYQDYVLFKSLKKKFPTLEVENNVCIKGNLDNLKIEENVIIQSNVVLHLGGYEWCDYQGALKIGKNSCLSPNVVIYAGGPGGVKIGENFDCGPGVGIFASRTDFTRTNTHYFAPVEIGNNVLIFANVVISPGVKIGDNVVIAANSVVNSDIPSNTFVGGCPAKLIRNL